MPITEWHTETWSEVVDTLREHMETLGFIVHVSENMGTVTIIHQGNALTVMNTTGSHLTGGAVPGDPIAVHLPS